MIFIIYQNRFALFSVSFLLSLKTMSENPSVYVWRCAKCTNHFASISKLDGLLKLEKKCPKCKSQNEITLTSKEIFIRCQFFDPRTNNYGQIQENLPYPLEPDE